jgi:hypothetical protein
MTDEEMQSLAISLAAVTPRSEFERLQELFGQPEQRAIRSRNLEDRAGDGPLKRLESGKAKATAAAWSGALNPALEPEPGDPL